MTANNVQTSYDTDPAAAFAGQWADSGPRRTRSVIGEVAMAAGLVCLTGGTTKAEGRPPPAPDAADVDAIIATGASAASVQTVSGGSLDGVIGGAEIFPPRNLVLVLSSHANWDLTTATVTGEDAEGNVISEDFVIPDAGNATVTGAKFFSKVTSLRIPTQAGTSGTYTLGTGSSLGPLAPSRVHGITLYDASKKPEAWQIDEAWTVAREGRVYVYAEAAVDVGDPVYVRFVSTGSEVNGSMRGSPDSTDCARLLRARFASKTTGAGFAVVELNLP